MSFRDRINKIRETNANTPVVQNDAQTLRGFQAKADQYADEICEQIRNAIEERAQKSLIDYDDRKNLFGHFKKTNPRYSVVFRFVVKLDPENSVFSYEPMTYAVPYGDSEWRKGFRVNDGQTLRYLFDRVERQLEQDGIYYEDREVRSRYEQITRRGSIPVWELISKIDTQLDARRKDRNAHLYDLAIDWPFAFFIK